MGTVPCPTGSRTCGGVDLSPVNNLGTGQFSRPRPMPGSHDPLWAHSIWHSSLSQERKLQGANYVASYGQPDGLKGTGVSAACDSV